MSFSIRRLDAWGLFFFLSFFFFLAAETYHNSRMAVMDHIIKEPCQSPGHATAGDKLVQGNDAIGDADEKEIMEGRDRGASMSCQ